MQVVWMLDCHLGKWAILKLGTQQLAAQESDIKATLDYKHCCLAHMRILLGIVPFFAILYLTFTLDGFNKSVFGYASKKSKNAGTEEIESFGIFLLFLSKLISNLSVKDCGNISDL